MRVVSTIRYPWVLLVAVLLVVPGTLLSIALGGIGLLMLLLLLADAAFNRTTTRDSARNNLSVVAQVGLAAVIAGVLGGLIAVVAWVV